MTSGLDRRIRDAEAGAREAARLRDRATLLNGFTTLAKDEAEARAMLAYVRDAAMRLMGPEADEFRAEFLGALKDVQVEHPEYFPEGDTAYPMTFFDDPQAILDATEEEAGWIGR